MRKLIYILISFICFVSFSTAHATYHPPLADYSGVSNTSPPPMVGSISGVSIITKPSNRGLPYFIDQTKQFSSGQTSFHNRGFGPATYLNAGVTRTWYNRITDRLEIAQENDIPFHSLAGRDYFDCAAACTNYCLFSEDFTNAAWTKTRAGITLYGTDPMGGEKAMFFREDGTAAAVHFFSQTILKEVFLDNSSATVSLFAEADSRQWILIQVRAKDDSVVDCYFDVLNGTIGTSSGTLVARISENTINGAYRISLTGNIEAGAIDPIFAFALCDADNSKTYNGDANSGMTIWGVQITQTAWLAPYFATDASASIYPSSEGSLTYACPQGILAETSGGDLFDPGAGVFTAGTYNWVKRGTNGMVNDANSLKVTYVDDYRGAYLVLNDAEDLTTDMVIGDLYYFAFDMKVNSGATVDFILYDPIIGKRILASESETTFQSYIYYFVAYKTVTSVLSFDNFGTGEIVWIDNLVLEKVNSRISTVTDGEMSPHGTFIFHATPLFDADDMETYCGLFNFDGATGTTGFYISSSGRYSLGDGTNTAYAHAASGISAWQTSKVVGQWSILVADDDLADDRIATHGTKSMRIGVDRGDGLRWGDWETFDGFPETLFSVFEEGWGRVLLNGPLIFNRILPDNEIHVMGRSMKAAGFLPDLETVSTFHSIGIYWNPMDGASEASCWVRYAPEGDTLVTGYPLWFDGRGNKGRPPEFRGSLVNLQPKTTYDIELGYEGSGASEVFTATTWSEVFVAGSTTYLTGTTNVTIVIADSGSSGAYKLYTHAGSGATIDVADGEDYCIQIKDDVHHVIVRGVSAFNASRSGIFLGFGVHDIVIEGCNISGWGDGTNLDSAIRNEWTDQSDTDDNTVERIIVQRNKIYDPRSGASSWDYGHPSGPQAISLMNSEGNHVFRYNEIYSKWDYYYNDAMGHADNTSWEGFPNKDSDIYGNIFQHVWDNAIEAEGANMNVRIWGNYFDHINNPIGIVVTSMGPLYIWRNVSDKSRRTEDADSDDWERGRFLKVGGNTALPKYGSGRTYVFHNTILQDGPPAGKADTLGCRKAIEATQELYEFHARNNILINYRANIDVFKDQTNSCTNDLDFDLYSGKWDYDCATKPHQNSGISDFPVYDPSGTSQYELDAASPGFDAGVTLYNFNYGLLAGNIFEIDYAGVAPDMGAYETGNTPMQFGVTAYETP